MTAVMQIDGLGIAFGGLKAVDGVSFEVARHGITTIIGPNGAGKTTLFNLISGLMAPKSGKVRLDGRDVTRLSPAAMQRAGVARSFQITNLFFEMTIRENLCLAAQCLETPSRMLRPIRRSGRASEMVARLLSRFGFDAKAHEPVGNLSHGEQRRLEIAMCLASEPKLLMLDEPTQGMSHADTDDTAQLIHEIAGEVAILLIEHDVKLVMSLSDHVVVMHHGKILSEGTPAQIHADPAVQAAYFGQLHA